MKTVRLTCADANCQKEFDRPQKEHNRSLRLGRAEYCSRRCQGKNNTKHLEQYVGKYVSHLKKGRELDKDSPWREHIKRIRTRSKRKGWDVTLTVQDLQEIWDEQKGLCAYSHKSMYLPPSTKAFAEEATEPHWVSVDRKDSNKPYIRDNVQLVCLSVNLAKKDFSHEQMIDFFKS